jgi:pseudoazurin
MQRRTLLISTAAVALLPVLPASAAEVEVQMLNKGAAGAMVFEPAMIRVAAGDIVTFKSTNPGHNAETIPDMLPAGAEAFKGAMGKDVSVTFTVPGAYGIKCLPHLAMGMVALVIVGEPPAETIETVKTGKLPPLARRRMDAALAEYEATL